MKRLLYKILLLLLIILAGCSANNRYKTANNLYKRKNYAVAIQQYDRYLEKSANGAFATQAESERGDSYFYLGLQAFEKESWLLASRLFYLANNENADNALDNCYYKLAQVALGEQDKEKALEYYGYIVDHLEKSELVPEILFERINLYIDLGKKDDAFLDFDRLWRNYPESFYMGQVSEIIGPIIEHKLSEALAQKEKGELERSLQDLLFLIEYPTSFKLEISQEIAANYLLKAENNLVENMVDSVAYFFGKVVEYDPELDKQVTDRIDEICQVYIDQGNKFKVNLQIEKAISSYERCFLLISDYKPAKSAIQKAINYDDNYKRAITLREQARDKENDKLFRSALKLYESSYSLYRSKDVNSKINEMNNLISAEKDPKGFATAIIKNYKEGLISRKIRDIENEMIEKYGSEMVRISDWKVTYSSGDFKYEVRYDILTPNETFYFIWLVSLRDKNISPLNKLSEIL